jgi:hypothetical protein
MQKIAHTLSVATRRVRSNAIMLMVQRKKEAFPAGQPAGFHV